MKSRNIAHQQRSWLVPLGLSLHILAVSLAPPVAAHESVDMLDLVIEGGAVLDGTGAPDFEADLGIRDGRIVDLGDLSTVEAKKRINATGLFVVPGFINIHSHPQPNAVFRAENVLLQGITTEIGNPDGSGPLDIAEQASEMAANGLAANLGFYIGFNAVWAHVMGDTDGRPSHSDIQEMRKLISSGLSDGAWGVSAGLDYKPAYFARQDEVVGIVSVARPWRTNFPSHPRIIADTGFSSIAAVQETVDIGRKAGLTPVLTHVKLEGRDQGLAEQLLGLVDRETTAGRFTPLDVYPYTYGFNNISSLMLPAWSMEGGNPRLLERFKDPVLRQRIATEIESALDYRWNGPRGVYIVPKQMELTELMEQWGVSAGEAIIRLNEEHGPKYETYLRFGIEDDLIKILKHPNVAIACDCGSLLEVKGHPRAFGTFPAVLGRYVREDEEISWAAAVRKMTALPASIIGMTDRGLIALGMSADITVFDPKTISDRGSANVPELPQGVRYVIVNGQLAVDRGALTGAQGGTILTRRPNMPSRALEVDRDRRLQGSTWVRGGESSLRVTFNFEQAAEDRAAFGKLLVRDRRGREIFSARRLGILQTGPHWASVTGVGAWRNGQVGTFMLIFDDDPRAISERSVTLLIDGTNEFSGPVRGAQITRTP